MSTGDSEGPAWNKFWLSLEHETESMASGDGSQRPHTPGLRSLLSPDPSSRPGADRIDSVLPNESASHHGDESLSEAEVPGLSPVSPEDAPFPFKFKSPKGRVHRLHVVASAGVAELIANVTEKLGAEVDAVGGPASFEEGKLGKSGYALSYLDDEGDTVSITTDRDLQEAISLAHRSHREKVDLFVHDPEKPSLSATLDPHPALPRPVTPPAASVRERRRPAVADDDEDTMPTPVKKERKAVIAPSKQEQQMVPGVPNDLLLPGAIVTLAIVIIGVFALSRSSSR